MGDRSKRNQVEGGAGASLRGVRNPLQWKLPEIYEKDHKRLLPVEDPDPELVIFCNQTRLPMEGL